jgi:hypothetical protein
MKQSYSQVTLTSHVVPLNRRKGTSNISSIQTSYDEDTILAELAVVVAEDELSQRMLLWVRLAILLNLPVVVSDQTSKVGTCG